MQNRLVSGLRILNIINKSSKLFGAWVLETQTAQPCGKLAVVCPLMSFPHPLQNRVPRVRILLPLPKTLPDGKSDMARNSLEFRAFLVFWGGGMRSMVPLSMACILRFFRIWSYPFLTFPSGTSSINHHKSGTLSLLGSALAKNRTHLLSLAGGLCLS